MCKITGMSCKKTHNFCKSKRISNILCLFIQYKQVISVLNFVLKILAVDEKIAFNFRGYCFSRTLYTVYNADAGRAVTDEALA